ncbi:28S ribosomal protein S31, mitochondrial isoform X1 [Sorex araneus]|uniref:28S ribosomal protein S31, mitochondrial isoform X1 n=1 Tax=Sorex araneus TaxID=42254 RepID=UPI0024338884|nr:28S ribosomal protein S31, mitochondrial isoform X1 [Sorex araneus]
MLPRVSAAVCLRPGPRLPWGPSAPLAARTNNIQRYFGTTRVICSKKDEQSVPPQETSKETEGKDGVKEKKKKDLLDIIKGMKIELSALNVRTTKPPSRRPVRTLPTAIGRPRKAAEDAPKQRGEPLSPELVSAVSAVADSLPFDKQTTKSELLRQLQQHEKESRAQKEGERPRISFSNLISDMKVDRNATARVSTRPVHQIQFDEGPDHILDEKTINVRKSIQRSMSKGKRLNIFELKTDTAEAPGADEAPTLWDVEFAKQLATVSQQPFRNGFEEMIEWTKEGKLWTFPIDNEAGFDDDGSEFHEHIFLDKYLEDFPKQGPIRHFMELVTCGLSKNPYLSVKQKVEHIEWFRNYFNEKQDILKESGIQFS